MMTPQESATEAMRLLDCNFEPGDRIEFRTFGTIKQQHWCLKQDAQSVIITKLSTFGPGTHICVSGCTRLRDGGKTEDVELARCLYADFDKTTVEEARSAWTKAGLPEPTVVVKTGGGVHAYWRLKEPITDLVEFSQRQKALAIRLGSDESICDAPRVMRLPGFPNWKYPAHPMCVVDTATPANVWSIDQFPLPQPVLPEQAPIAVEPQSMSNLSKRFIDEGFVMKAGRRQTIYTVACDLKARSWSHADATQAIMPRVRTLGLSAVDLADVPRQITNAFSRPRSPLAGAATEADLGPIIYNASNLIAEYPTLRRPIIHGLLRSGETMNIISAPKMGKSWLVNALAIMASQGGPWLGFQCVKSKVLLIDNELHKETMSSRLGNLCLKMKVHYAGKYTQLDDLDIVNIRGHLMDFDKLGATLINKLKAGSYDLIILDSFYRFIPANTTENDNGAMARIFNLIDGWAKKNDCSFVMIHHTSKGDQSDKAVTDVGAGAGSMARATDTHLILRRHEEEGHFVLEAVTRSFPPIKPKVLHFDFPLFVHALTMNPKHLKKAGKIDDGWTAERFAKEIVGNRRMSPAELIAAGMAQGLTTNRVKTLRILAEGAGLLAKEGNTTNLKYFVPPTPAGAPPTPAPAVPPVPTPAGTTSTPTPAVPPTPADTTLSSEVTPSEDPSP